MNTFFRLLDNIHIPGRWHLGEILRNGRPVEAWVGNPIKDKQPLQATLDRPGQSLDFSLTSFAAPIARTSIANAIASVAGTDIQHIPIQIDGNAGFEVLNAVRIVDCLNEAESEFIKWTEKDHRPEFAGQYRMVTTLKIDPTRVPRDAHFFRIKGWRIGLIVSKEVKTAMEVSGCFGAIFDDVT
jgi:hypothetical protein